MMEALLCLPPANPGLFSSPAPTKYLTLAPDPIRYTEEGAPTCVQKTLPDGAAEGRHKRGVQAGAAEALPHVLDGGPAVGVCDHDIKHLVEAAPSDGLVHALLEASAPSLQPSRAGSALQSLLQRFTYKLKHCGIFHSRMLRLTMRHSAGPFHILCIVSA